MLLQSAALVCSPAALSWLSFAGIGVGWLGVRGTDERVRSFVRPLFSLFGKWADGDEGVINEVNEVSKGRNCGPKVPSINSIRGLFGGPLRVNQYQLLCFEALTTDLATKACQTVDSRLSAMMT